MVYLYYISCLRYTILVGNPRRIIRIKSDFHQSLCLCADDDQEGVMDNLLEALKTGSAFNVNREKREGRRRPPRAAGGGFQSCHLSQCSLKPVL